MSKRLRRRRVNLRWYYMTVVPWALSVGILVSTTASAGLEVYYGRSEVSKSSFSGSLMLGALMPPSDARPGFDLGSDPLKLFSFDDDNPSEPFFTSYLPPNDEMKVGIKGYPVGDTTEKGNPVKSITPSLSRHAFKQFGGFLSPQSSFSYIENTSLSILSPSFDPSQIAFKLMSDVSVTQVSSSVPTPVTAATGSTGSGITFDIGDGATPTELRAIIISSSTPIPFHLMPEEVAALPVSLPGSAPLVDQNVPVQSRPNYSGVLTGRNTAREARCLAEAVYFEARSEPPEGQAAVAQVVLNRARSGLYPSSICGVVYQNSHRYLACQFTFTCEGKSLRVSDSASWKQAQKIANDVLQGKTYLAQVGGSTHYHADYVNPYWSRKLKKTDTIGRHIFYSLKPGQR